MWRKMSCLSVTAVVLVLAGGASGTEYHWTNDGDGNSWCNQFNWDPNTSVPGSGDDVRIRRTYITQGPLSRGPIVDCDAECAYINGPFNGQVVDVISGTLHIGGNWDWQEAGGTSTVNITGSSVVDIGGTFYSPKNDNGILNISGSPIITAGAAKFANDSSSSCTMTMNGGSFSVGGRLEWEDGEGELNMSGGATIECGEFNFQGNSSKTWTLNLNGGTMTANSRFRAPEKGSGNVFINLDAGTLECGTFEPSGVYAMDINEGIFIIHGDVKAAMEADVDAGYITAFNDTVGVLVELADGNTIVKADYVKVKASNPSPANYAMNVCPGVELSWDAGAYAVDHNVYFGTSLGDVNESADPCLDHYGSTQWTPTGLALGTKYYWRVDEVDDACESSPWVGDVWEFTTNDGNAFDPYPTDKKTAVALDVDLYWTSGCGADSHDVYFGTDYNGVRDATSTSHPDVVYENRVVNNFDPGTLDYYTWYYWRVDEVDGGNTYEGEVWSFRSVSLIVDPNLLLWYKLDESEGTIVSDSSGYEHHGSGYGIAGEWEPNNGQIDGCLDFEADQHVLVPSDTLDLVAGEITVAVWVNGAPGQDEDDDMIVFDAGDLGGGDYKLTGIIPTDEPGLDVHWQAGNDTNDLLLWTDATPEAWRGDWHHFAFVKSENEGKMHVYFDGFLRKSKDCITGTLANVRGKAFRIGAQNNSTSSYDGKLDDFRVYDRALSSDEVLEFIRGDLHLAWAPRPYDGRPGVPPDVNLVWNPGDYTISHDIYLGTSLEDVNDAVTTDPEFKVNHEPNMYDPPAPLEMGETYYWRVDEVNGPNTWKGPVWRFTVADFIVLDDFERYDNSNNLIWYTWYCKQAMPYGRRSGAYLSLSTDPVHTGEQAMKYDYETDDNQYWDQDYAYADACLPLDEINGFQDWTSVGVRQLTIFFYGQAGNDANETEQMYMGVEDSALRYAEMRYGDHDGEALSDLKVEGWQRWDVPFIWFTDSNAAVSANIDFSAISSVYLGFGDKSDPVRGGSGTVYFDDLRLSMPFCRPEYGPIGDLSGDCFVGVADIGTMADQWLRSDVNANPVTQPSDANLVGHWELEGNADDSSTSGYHGTAEGSFAWVDGRVGSGAIEVDGGWIVVEDEGNTPKLRPKHYVSVMAWIYLDGDAGTDSKVVIKGEDNEETFGLEVDDDDGAAFIFRDANNPGSVLSVASGGNAIAGNEWIHIAGTYDNNEQLVYVNGAEAGSETRGVIELFTDANDGLGIGGRYGDGGDFDGKIDDVRVYDRAVSAAEIGYIACGSDGMCLLESEANFYSGEEPEVINFRDFARLFDYWGAKQLWPPEPSS